MKKARNTKILLLALLLISMSGCNLNTIEERCKAKHHELNKYIDNELKDYFFKEGTYWVYENTVTHEIDSQYVYKTKHYFQINGKNSECGPTYVEAYFLYVYDTVQGYKNCDVSYGFTIYGIGQSGFDYQNDALSSSTGVYYSASVLPSEVYLPSPGSINIGTNNFYNIKAFHIVPEVYMPGFTSDDLRYTTDFYFSPKIGIVSRVEYDTPNGTVEWNLKRWHIEF